MTGGLGAPLKPWKDNRESAKYAGTKENYPVAQDVGAVEIPQVESNLNVAIVKPSLKVANRDFCIPSAFYLKLTDRIMERKLELRFRGRWP